jgi:hypothetical protein
MFLISWYGVQCQENMNEWFWNAVVLTLQLIFSAISVFVLLRLKYNCKESVKKIEVGGYRTFPEGMLEWFRGTLRGVLKL